MKVLVKVNNFKIEINCGEGQQTFQWLGSVIRERICSNKYFKKTLGDENFIISEIRNTDNELINPKDCIFEHYDQEKGLEVTATLDTFKVDEYGDPIYSDWNRVSMLHSKESKHWIKETESWRVSLNNAKDLDVPWISKASEELTNYNIKSRLVNIGFDLNENDLELAFQLDWHAIKLAWLKPTELLKSKIGSVLKSNYSVISNLFIHYAGHGQVGQRYGMTLEELGHLLHFMKIFHFKKNEELIEQLYHETLPNPLLKLNTTERKEREDSKSSFNLIDSDKKYWPLIVRSQLAEILILAASQFYNDTPIDQAFRTFIEGPVTDYWRSLSSNYIIYTSPEPGLKKSFQEYYHLLKEVFLERSTIDYKRYGPRLSLKDFIKTMKVSTLIDDSHDNFALFCFLQAQLNPTTVNELEHIIFIEFIEAISRLAIKIIENYDGLTEAKKIRMAFNLVIELTAGSSGMRK